MLFATFLLIASVSAETPQPMEAPELPVDVSVPLIMGEIEDYRRPNFPEHGSLYMSQADLHQGLVWRPAGKTLQQRANLDREQAYSVNGLPLPADLPPIASFTIGDTTGLNFEVQKHFEEQNEDYLIMSAHWECADLQVSLSTFGTVTDQIRQVHRASLEGASCGAREHEEQEEPGAKPDKAETRSGGCSIVESSTGLSVAALLLAGIGLVRRQRR